MRLHYDDHLPDSRILEQLPLVVIAQAVEP